MFLRKRSRAKNSRGQSLVETALIVPLLLILILNAINFGYFLLVTLNLTSATRNGIEYAIQGSSTPRNASLPTPGSPSSAGTVSYLIYQELSGLKGASTIQVQVCSLSVPSSDESSTITSCQTCTNSGCSTSAAPSGLVADPEAASGFALNRIDVSYTFNTLIPSAPFNLVVGALPPCQSSGSCKFTRHAAMRAMGS